VTSDIGLPYDAAADAAEHPGVATVTAVVDTGVMVEYTELGDPTVQTFSARGITPDTFGRTVDLGVRSGSLDDLSDGTVAVGRLAAATVGVDVGDTLPLRLGDGSAIEPRVIAIYDRDMGLGDFTFPKSTLEGHVTYALDDMLLIEVADGADAAAVRDGLDAMPYAGLSVTDRAGFEAAQSEALTLDAWVNLLVGGVLLGYIAISVTNSLIIGTVARARELALLRLVGATRRQVLRMMRWEGVIVVATAIVIGTVIAGATLVMLGWGLTGHPLPYVPPLAGAALLAGVAALGITAIMLPTRHVLRSPATETIGTRE
jgi:putative ABC transport system permease protein